MSSADIDAYIARTLPAFAAALTALRARLCALLPDLVEVISYAMPACAHRGQRANW